MKIEFELLKSSIYLGYRRLGQKYEENNPLPFDLPDNNVTSANMKRYKKSFNVKVPESVRIFKQQDQAVSRVPNFNKSSEKELSLV